MTSLSKTIFVLSRKNRNGSQHRQGHTKLVLKHWIAQKMQIKSDWKNTLFGLIHQYNAQSWDTPNNNSTVIQANTNQQNSPRKKRVTSGKPLQRMNTHTINESQLGQSMEQSVNIQTIKENKELISIQEQVQQLENQEHLDQLLQS